MTTMTTVPQETILLALDQADAEWRARYEDSRLAIPGQADAAEAAALAIEAPNDLLCGWVLGLYAVNAHH